MTVAAIDSVIADVMLMAERDRLLEWDIDVGGVRRPKNFGSRPASSTHQNNGAENDDSGINIGARRKELSHEPLCLLQKEMARQSQQWPLSAHALCSTFKLSDQRELK